jgi:hypothetical protein
MSAAFANVKEVAAEGKILPPAKVVILSKR